MDEVIDELVADLASGLIDASDEEIAAKLDEYGLSDEDKADVLETIKQVKEAEGLADANPDPLSLENVDAMADAQAKQMADEDNTDVTITSEDKDGDSDTDSISIEKSPVSDEDMQAMQDLLNSDSDEGNSDEGNSDEGNSDESDDKPHSEKLNENVLGAISSRKY